MALYRFECKVVRRSKGESAIKRAAYNSREKLFDERLGKTYNFSTDHDLEWDGVFAPKDAPQWARNRQSLWNEVERYEDQNNRKAGSARTARSFIIALPHELTLEQSEWLVKDFARELVRKGMVVDAAIHMAPVRGKPDRIDQMLGAEWSAGGDSRNRHAHLMTTMRDIGPDGFGKKNRDWDKREELEHWRERWAQLGSKALARAGFEQEAERFNVAHLTLSKQRKAAMEREDYRWAKECNREPQIHMGAAAMGMEGKDIQTRKGDINREIAERNKARQMGKQPRLPGRINHSAERMAGKTLEFAAGAVESFFARTLTPQEKERGRIADIEKSLAAEAAEQQRRWEAERGRDR